MRTHRSPSLGLTETAAPVSDSRFALAADGGPFMDFQEPAAKAVMILSLQCLSECIRHG